MKSIRVGNEIILRLDKGDEIIESLKKIAKKENIKAGKITGIGATDDFKVGVFNLTTNKYDEISYNENSEINNLTGNFSFVNNENYVHTHITCTGKICGVVGGHLLYAKISLTAEIFITVLDTEITRFYDKELKINRWDF